MENKNKTALVTGASSGIGRELAKLFAEDKYELVLVSRDENKLNEVAAELKRLGSPKVTVVAKDLSIQGAADEVYKETQSRGIEINFLVNDAGVGLYGEFVQNSLEKS